MTHAPETLLRLSEVMKRTGLNRSAVYRLIAAGQFPRQVKLSVRASAWADSAVSAWIAARLNSASQYPDPTSIPTRAEAFDEQLGYVLRDLLTLHRAHMSALGRDPDKYESAYSRASREILVAADKLPHRKKIKTPSGA